MLDVGSGSGYLCAVLHYLVGSTGQVVGIDHIPELVEWSVENLKNDGLTSALENKSIEMITGDGRQGAPHKRRSRGHCALTRFLNGRMACGRHVEL